jgi:prepilin-type N-terminal cleavage/methylation domain-containing protein
MWNGLKNNRGFVLIELSIALAIFGVLVSSAMTMARSYIQWAKNQKTIDHQKTMIVALQQHMAMHGFLPMPEGVDQVKSPWAWWGIPPYRQLGLPAHVAKDGHGRWMVYVTDAECHWLGPLTLDRLVRLTFGKPSKLDVWHDGHLSVNQGITQSYNGRGPFDGVAAALISSDKDLVVNQAARDAVLSVDTMHNITVYRKDSDMRMAWVTRGQIVKDLTPSMFFLPDSKSTNANSATTMTHRNGDGGDTHGHAVKDDRSVHVLPANDGVNPKDRPSRTRIRLQPNGPPVVLK